MNISALETLNACGVEPAIHAGTGVGALIGGLYASGTSGKEVRSFVDE